MTLVLFALHTLLFIVPFQASGYLSCHFLDCPFWDLQFLLPLTSSDFLIFRLAFCLLFPIHCQIVECCHRVKNKNKQKNPPKAIVTCATLNSYFSHPMEKTMYLVSLSRWKPFGQSSLIFPHIYLSLHTLGLFKKYSLYLSISSSLMSSLSCKHIH